MSYLSTVVEALLGRSQVAGPATTGADVASASLEAAIAERDARIVAQQEELRSREARITALEAATDATLRAQVACLELDVGERDARMATMQREYAELQAEAARAGEAVSQRQLLQLFKKLSPSLSNIAALVALAEAGREVAAADFVALFQSLERTLKSAGMETVGRPGDRVPFDLVLHQRMSGGSVSPGALVVVRTPGYRAGDTVLLRAMVTSTEAGDE